MKNYSALIATTTLFAFPLIVALYSRVFPKKPHDKLEKKIDELSDDF
jgi:hypothetical protein